MRYNRVLLISPKIRTGRFQLSLHPPAGLGYLAQSLEQNGILYDTLDMNLGYNQHYLKNKIHHFSPDLMAISMMTFMYRDNYNMISDIKKTYPELKIIAGGPHISTFRTKALFDCPDIDYGVVMEGEDVLVELCTGQELPTLKGLIYRNDGKIIFNGEREFISDLDRLPFPKYDRFSLDRYPTSQIGIVTSRGCPFNCIFCPVSLAIGKKFRFRGPESIVNELEYWFSRGHREILFLDDNFTLMPERIRSICELIKIKKLNGLKLKCPNGVRADKVDKDLLEEMKEAGFVMLAFGVEAGNDKILNNIRKGEKITQIEDAIKNACGLGYEVELFFLIGSPGETVNDVKDSIALAKRYPVYNAKFYNLIPFPETQLYDWVKKNGYFIENPQGYLNDTSHFVNKPCFETPEMSVKERKKMFKYTQKISRGIRRKSLEHRLKRLGYFSKLFAWLYTIEAIERLATGNSFLIKFKKNIAKILHNDDLSN